MVHIHGVMVTTPTPPQVVDDRAEPSQIQGKLPQPTASLSTTELVGVTKAALLRATLELEAQFSTEKVARLPQFNAFFPTTKLPMVPKPNRKGGKG